MERDFWREETEVKAQDIKASIEYKRNLLNKVQNDPYTPQHEKAYEVRNILNSIANDEYLPNKCNYELSCNHSWKCLGGGGQYMSDVCEKCGASFDY